MKNYISLLICGVFVLLCSCASKTQTVKVTGKPGTVIASSDYKALGTIGTNGYADITLSRDYFTPFLLSYDSNTKTYTPFALDFINKNKKTGAQLVNGVAITLASAGLIGMLAGTILVCADSEDPAGAALLGGGAAIGVGGAGLGLAADSKLSKSDVEYSYSYSTSSINSDLSDNK